MDLERWLEAKQAKAQKPPPKATQRHPGIDRFDLEDLEAMRQHINGTTGPGKTDRGRREHRRHADR